MSCGRFGWFAGRLESLWVVSSFTGNGASSSNNAAVYRHIFSEF